MTRWNPISEYKGGWVLACFAGEPMPSVVEKRGETWYDQKGCELGHPLGFIEWEPMRADDDADDVMISALALAETAKLGAESRDRPQWSISHEKSAIDYTADKIIRFAKSRRKPKYLVIGIYDSGINLSVCDSGTMVDDVEPYYNAYNKPLLDNKEKFAPFLGGYDLVVVCENGDIEVLKETRTEI